MAGKLPQMKKHYEEGVKKAKDLRAYCKAIARVLGVSEDVVCASIPAKNWEDFAANVDQYSDKFINRYKEAFTTTA